MHPDLLRKLAGRKYAVRIRSGGEVAVEAEGAGYALLDYLDRNLDHAVCNELKEALEDALLGEYLGGYTLNADGTFVNELDG
jgi:hypothetical protein